MKRLLLLLSLCAGLAGLTVARAEDKKPADDVAVLKFKDYGDIVIEFWPDVAPKTVENFQKLAKSKFYDGTLSHRLIPGFMVQLGDPNTKDPSKEAQWGQGGPGWQVKAEFNAKKHVKGTVSMARSSDPDSAGSQFFICFDTASNLDGQYTAFGKVISGLDVLDKLEQVRQVRSKPQTPVVLESVTIMPRSEYKPAAK